MLSKPEHYDKLDYNTFPVFDMKHTIAPIKGKRLQDKLAIWPTPEATYVVMANKQLWNMMYFRNSSKMFIRDRKTGKEYPTRETIGLPMDTTYWVKGVPGEWFAIVKVFPPLPASCTHIDIEGEKKKQEYIPNTTGWSNPYRVINVSIQELLDNQEKMKFWETVIVK